jgi:hypothetical protein
MQLRQAGASVPPAELEASAEDPATISSLQARVAHLEQLLVGLQDAVHREQTRQHRRISELEARTEPAALAVALNRDERERGL